MKKFPDTRSNLIHGAGGRREMVFDSITGRNRPMVDAVPTASSAPLPWRGFLLEHHRMGGAEVREVSCHNHVLTLHLSSPLQFEWKVNGRFRTFQKQPGEISLVPAGMFFSGSSRMQTEFLSVSLEEVFLRQTLQDLPRADKLELVPRVTMADPLIESVARALRADLAWGHAAGTLYGESLAASLALHLARHHSVQKPRAKQFKRGLTPGQLRRAVEYLHSNFAGEVSLATLSGVVGISAFHFARLFKNSTGLATHPFHIKCRLERAKELLHQPEARIADVAAQVGFCDQSHLALHFKRAYGVTPGSFLNGNGRH